MFQRFHSSQGLLELFVMKAGVECTTPAFGYALLRTDLTRRHAADHVLHPRNRSNDECHDRERSGGGTELNRKAGRISANNDVCLPDADKRRESDEKEKETESPLGYQAARGTCVSLLFTHESHNEKGRRGKWKTVYTSEAAKSSSSLLSSRVLLAYSRRHEDLS